jgi:5-methylcytosine-specific restriction endonuclease McrA
MSYADLLKDPKWLKKRAEIIAEAGGQCTTCRTFDGPFHVHHTLYIKGRMPWDYDGNALMCLCPKCHERQHPNGNSSHIPKYDSGWDENCHETLVDFIMTFRWN